MTTARRPPASGSVTARAPAKVNLHLGVGALRADGFHPLVTVYHAVGLCDEVTVTAAPPGHGWQVTMTAGAHVDASGVPTGHGNLVVRAADLLARHHGVPLDGRVGVSKAIPVAGGLAGGSADAAATLVACDRLWQLHTAEEDLLELAAELGSDVPFALVGGTALGTGRGEVVTPVADAGGWSWVLVVDRTGLSTPEVYRRFDRRRRGAPTEPAAADTLLEALAGGEPRLLAEALHNDLQPAALDLRPALADLLDLGRRLGALGGVVSGSGPTCAFLGEDPDHARRLAAALRDEGAPAALVARGPAPGAHVVEP